jgi:hypothetical protein
MAVALRIRIIDVDLRPGLTPNQLRILGPQSLGPILAEIRSCLPFFVAVVGHQYGAELEQYIVPSDPDYMWVQNYPQGRSILELELFAGALRDAQRSIGCIFLRSDSSIDDPEFKAAADMCPPLSCLPPLPSDTVQRSGTAIQMAYRSFRLKKQISKLARFTCLQLQVPAKRCEIFEQLYRLCFRIATRAFKLMNEPDFIIIDCNVQVQCVLGWASRRRACHDWAE